jgi:CheY-like chemotaxis protein
MGAKPFQSTNRTSASPAAAVVIVNGTPGGLGTLDTLLEPGQYDIINTASTSDAYSVIKRVKPILVLMGLPLDDLDTFQVLSMLKLDPETSEIPIVLCTLEQVRCS